MVSLYKKVLTMSRQVLYVGGDSALVAFGAGAQAARLRQPGLPAQFWRALSELKNEDYGLIVLHGLYGLTIDEEVVTSLQGLSACFLLGWDAGDPAGGHEGFEVVPPPVTAAALTQAVALS